LVLVRHEVVDVAVLRTSERPTAPVVLPAVSYRECVSSNGEVPSPRDNVSFSFGRTATTRVDVVTASINAVGDQDRVDGSTDVKQR
jgi:hypothetical protein